MGRCFGRRGGLPYGNTTVFARGARDLFSCRFVGNVGTPSPRRQSVPFCEWSCLDLLPQVYPTL